VERECGLRGMSEEITSVRNTRGIAKGREKGQGGSNGRLCFEVTVQLIVKNRHFWPDNSRNRRLLTAIRQKHVIFLYIFVYFPSFGERGASALHR
jgi:hypothetical protein